MFFQWTCQFQSDETKLGVQASQLGPQAPQQKNTSAFAKQRKREIVLTEFARFENLYADPAGKRKIFTTKFFLRFDFVETIPVLSASADRL